MWEAQLSIVDWVYFKTQTLRATSTTWGEREESLMYIRNMTKVFHFLQKKLGITAVHSTFFDGNMKDQCVHVGNVHLFVNESSHSSWTKLLFCEFGDLQEHELRGNWEFIQYHTEIDTGAFWRDSQCTYDSQLLSILDEISVVSWSRDPVDRSKSACLLWLRTMLGENEW